MVSRTFKYLLLFTGRHRLAQRTHKIFMVIKVECLFLALSNSASCGFCFLCSSFALQYLTKKAPTNSNEKRARSCLPLVRIVKFNIVMVRRTPRTILASCDGRASNNRQHEFCDMNLVLFFVVFNYQI